MPSQRLSKAELRQRLEAGLARLRGALEGADRLRVKAGVTEAEEALFDQIKAEAERLEHSVRVAMTDH